MSIEHLNAAFNSSVKPSARKFVLVALADYANETGLAYPSIETLSNKTGQDRKTVRQHLIALSEQGIISDTGERVGKTKQIPKYQINIQRLPKMVLLKTTKTGTVTKAKTPKNGRVKATKNGTLKDSQKRYTEPPVSFNHQKEPPADKLNGFDKFWFAYPKKKSKGTAERAWIKIKPDNTLQTKILSQVEKAKKSQDWKKDNGKYIPHPATWLNGKRWEDEDLGSISGTIAGLSPSEMANAL